MRPSLFISLALLLTLPLGDSVRRPAASHLESHLTQNAERACQSDAPHRDQASIEDETLQRHLIREGTSLIESGRTAPAQLLIQQLQRKVATVNIPGATPVAHTPVQLVQSARESVVVVSGLYRCRRCDRWHAGTASGFVIAPDGIVVTNHHVVNDSTLHSIVVMTSDGRVFPVEEVLAASLAQDLAILRVPAKDLVPLPVATSLADAPVGTPIMVISHPDSQYYSCTEGIVSRYFRTRSEGEIVNAVSITADYARGSSGAPVLNNQGQVIGIVKSTESVYYTESVQEQRDLQMVFKTCVPAQSLMGLVKPSEEPLHITAAAVVRGSNAGI